MIAIALIGLYIIGACLGLYVVARWLGVIINLGFLLFSVIMLAVIVVIGVIFV